MKNFLRSWGLLAVVLLAAASMLAFAYFGRTVPPSPPAPIPVPAGDLEILGPETARSGEISVYTTEYVGPSFAWIVTPGSGQDIRVLEGGRTLVVVYSVPGKHAVVLAAGGQKVALTTIETMVDGPNPPLPPGPPIPPTPPEPPKPPTPPEPANGKDWEKWAEASVRDYVSSYPQKGEDVKSLAGALESIAAQIAAGAVKDTAAARELWRSTAVSKISDARQWVEFSNRFKDECIKQEKEGWLTELSQYRAMYVALAKGFRSVQPKDVYAAAIEASSDDRRPVVVVITSEGCPPCEALKAEYLPKADLHGARIVHLDRKDDAELIGKYRLALTGMKGRIVVPQVTIIRYAGGSWRQFNTQGYTTYEAMDRWVRSAFGWEN